MPVAVLAARQRGRCTARGAGGSILHVALVRGSHSRPCGRLCSPSQAWHRVSPGQGACRGLPAAGKPCGKWEEPAI